jgi:hypothetical protein
MKAAASARSIASRMNATSSRPSTFLERRKEDRLLFAVVALVRERAEEVDELEARGNVDQMRDRGATGERVQNVEGAFDDAMFGAKDGGRGGSGGVTAHGDLLWSLVSTRVLRHFACRDPSGVEALKPRLCGGGAINRSPTA